MFCVECGREVDSEKALVGGLCLECLAERAPLVRLPPVLDLVRCPTCGAVRDRGTWHLPGASKGRGRSNDGPEGDDEDARLRTAVSELAEGELEVMDEGRLVSVGLRVLQEDRNVFVVDVQADVAIAGGTVGQEASTRVRVRREACDVCSRRSGNYYEAIVQFRGARERPASERDLDEAVALAREESARMEAASRDAYVVKVERPRKGGLDLYMSTQSAGAQLARALATRFGASVSVSTTLVGRKLGKDVLRATHIVRLPDLRSGDYVLFDGELMRVLSATEKDALLEPAVGMGRRRKVSHTDRTSLELVGPRDAVEEAVVVSSSPDEVQVLDPVTLQTVELRLPKGCAVTGRETVGVLRHEDRLLLAR
jgi:nonsense-mediated mRNA decay protein 3